MTQPGSTHQDAAPFLPASKEETDQYRLLFQANPCPMWVHDEETLAFLVVNEAAIEQYGYTREEFLAMAVPDLYLPEDAGAAAARLREPRSRERASAGLWRHRRRGGTIRTTQIVDGDVVLHGRPARLVIASDVDVQRELESSLSLLRATLESTADGILVVDSTGKIVALNGKFVELWRIPADIVQSRDDARAIGFVLSQLSNPDAFLAKVRELYEHPDQSSFDVLHFTDGRIFERYSQPQRVGDDVVGRVWSFRDVTERERSAESLRASEERYRTVARLTDSIIYEWDIATNTAQHSEAITSVLGILRHEAPPSGDWWLERMHPEDRDRARDTADRAIADGGSEWAQEYRIMRADGTYAVVFDRGHIVRDEAGRALKVLGTVTEITERRILEEQLRQAQKMEAVGRLAGGIAHDFNNLLTVIGTYTDLLREDFSPDDARRDDLDEIRKAAERAAALTRQLLAFSRKQLIQPRVVDLNVVIAQSTLTLRRLAGDRVQLRTLASADAALVRTDPGQLEELLANLVVNARDAMAGEGSLAIETSIVQRGVAPGESGAALAYVRLAVRDTGHGMDRATQARIFEPFFTTKGQGKGTGLGLATVYSIVTQAKGFVEVESEVGRGTTFLAHFPLVHEERSGASAPAAESGAGGSEMVLLVEDEDSLRALARRILERKGYRVLEARHGGEALDQLRNSAVIDLVVTDVVMPQMGGRELAEQLAQLRPATPVLFMSGYTDDDIIRRGLLEPGTAFLPKPFTAEGLAHAVRQVLDGARAGRPDA